jgi:uncharacterized membrane protein
MGTLHPLVVHFAIGLGLAGVAFRLLSLTRRFAFSNAAATTLVLVATIVSFVAVQTGTDAHGPVERIPGVRAAVEEHEAWGERARNTFTALAALEVVALVLYLRQHRRAYTVALAAAVVGVGASFAMYEAAEHGGSLVYEYAGGVGIRTGNPDDVNRLFVAGAYQQALQDRQANRSVEAMQLIDLAAGRFTGNLELQMLAAEWTTDVKQDPAGAIARLDRIPIPSGDTRLRVRAGLARARALEVQGNRDGARAVVQTLLGEFPDRADLKGRLAELSGGR